MKLRVACALGSVLFMCDYVIPQISPPGISRSKAAVISGEVMYKNGTPVESAEVEVHTFGESSGILPQPVLTDKKGHYQISYPPLGDGVISASKPTEGYPNAALALYGRREVASTKRVSLTSALRLDHVNLRMEHPRPVVTFEVEDATTGHPIEDARIVVEWSDDSEMMISQTIPRAGTFSLVLPEHSINVTIVAPGKKPWHWTERLLEARAHKSYLVMQKTLIVDLVPREP